MRIQHNIAALNSYRNLSNNNSAVSKNLEKLSSGYKINRAGDDAAGLAISEKMRAQITGLETAQKNAQDGISLVQTAEGALTEVHSMLNRMVELANQSANGTYQDEVDRENLQKEIDSLVSEIDRISKSTNFNGINLLDGTMGGTTPTVTPTDSLVVGEMTNSGVSEKVAGATNATAEYEIDFSGVQFGKDGVANVKFGNFDLNIDVTKDMTAEDFASAVADAINKSALGTDAVAAAQRAASGLKFNATADGTKVTIKANANGVDDVSGLAGGKTTVAITEGKKPDDTPLISGALKSDSVSIVETGADSSKEASYKFDLSGLSFSKDGTVTLTVGNFSVDVEVTKGMSSKDFAEAAAAAISKAEWGANGPTGKFTASAAADGTITITAANQKADTVSGLADGSGKISVAMKDPNNEIGEPMVNTSTNGGKLGEFSFEFAKGVSDKTKADFNAALNSDGFGIDFTVTYSATSGTGSVTVGTTSIPEDYKLQYKGNDGNWVDVTDPITITDSASGTQVASDAALEFRIVNSDASGANNTEVVAEFKFAGAPSSDVTSGKTTVTFAPPSSGSEKSSFVSALAERSTGINIGDQFQMDFSGLTNPTDTVTLKIDDITITLVTQNGATTDIASVSVGSDINETIENIVKTLNSDSDGTGVTDFLAKYDISAKDGVITFTAKTADPEGTPPAIDDSSTTWNEAKAIETTKVEKEPPVEVKKGDKFEMDFSSVSMPSDNDTLIINGVTITFGTDPGDVKIGETIEETMKNIAEALNKDGTFSKNWKVTADGGKLSFEALKDDAGELKIDGTSTWEAAKEVTANKVEDKPVSDVKTGEKYEMDFSTLSNPNNGDKLVIGDITVTFKDGTAKATLADGATIDVAIGSDVNETMSNLAAKLNETAGFKENWKVTAENGKLTFEALKDGVTVPAVGDGTTWTGADKVTANKVDDAVEPTDVPTLGEGITLQIGDTSDDYNRITVTIGDMSAAALGLEGLDISTQENAMAAIDKIKAAINTVSATRGDLGAIQNRLEHTINNLSVTTENMTAAESRIRDVDMAKEMMAYTKNNILVQSSQAMLAQANQIPQGVLQLLQ